MRWRRLSLATLASAALVSACGGTEPDLTAAMIPADPPTTSMHIHEDGEMHVHTGETIYDETSGDGPGSGGDDGHMGHDIGDMSGDHSGHDHSTTREVAKNLPVPSISVEVLADPIEGWNLHATVEDFRLAPENVSTDHVDGEGHMHLYIDAVKITRLFGPWYHLGQLEPGEREIRVELSSNDHSAMTYDGDIIDDTVVVTVPAP